MEIVVREEVCDNYGIYSDVVTFDMPGISYIDLCQSCLEKALAMVKGEDNGNG